MSGITTHILDTSRGRPAGGVAVRLELLSEAHAWVVIGNGRTDGDGRCRDLLPDGHVLSEGVYRLTFEIDSYFLAQKTESFYPEASVVFKVRDASEHYHVPLLLNPYGYSTYRGS
jgi:5-hydroxyisourate hydrolase